MLLFRPWSYLVSSPPFRLLVPLLLLAASFHCSVACLVRSLALQQPRQRSLHFTADVDHEFRVGDPSTRKDLVYSNSLINSNSLCPRSGHRSSRRSRQRQKRVEALYSNLIGHEINYGLTIPKKWYILDLCVSSLRRGHANLLCIVPILSYETAFTPLRKKKAGWEPVTELH